MSKYEDARKFANKFAKFKEAAWELSDAWQGDDFHGDADFDLSAYPKIFERSFDEIIYDLVGLNALIQDEMKVKHRNMLKVVYTDGKGPDAGDPDFLNDAITVPRICFKKDMDVYPHCIIKKGECGVLLPWSTVPGDTEIYAWKVFLDTTHDGLKEWNNCVHFGWEHCEDHYNGIMDDFLNDYLEGEK